VKVALITGAAQGIGLRTAELFAADGYALVLTDLRPLDRVEAGLATPTGAVLSVVGDVSDETVVKNMASTVRARFDRIDVVVNNAGVSSISPAEDITTDEWQHVMEVNLLGPFLVCREFGRMMLDQGSGSIVNVASVAGLLGIADRAAYNASKHGLIGLTRTLAAEWGGRGVRVNAVCPGWVKTPMDDASTAAGHYTNADIIGRVPMGRFATTDDVAQAIAFLADPVRGGFVNGHALSVDGGWYADGSWERLRLDAQGRTEQH
jgi:NAD(P)-dependent dehydrogenase (short-subunit alcohol dehydrogenase family)